ncbi:MAG TPA: PEP-CTERM sorting domain-containing protein [Leptolyngbyaceae cyanobacterium M33_DOE_097]|uniref:PEP-CTERM sorting domain-containing protein n=1 Tax=Oscillatoriales cyanobacterium SpSt-418 TaxID=2282169 RepID=A0A7C3KB29_9CYAN|nr:PEP-CTERM sorting domain-containing protein [Leptolyngbyaceae cyanobacterium M33_DOE_097]
MAKKMAAKVFVKTAMLTAGALLITTTSAYAKPNKPANGGGGAGGGGGFSVTNCANGSVTAGGLGFSDCAGTFTGNDTGSGDPLLTALMGGLFEGYSSAEGTWSLYGKSDDGKGNLIAGNGLTSGTWNVSEAITGPFVMSLKASNFYSAYLFDESFGSVTGGTFNTSGVAQKSGGGSPGLSHGSLFVFTPNTKPSTAVPEPFTILGTTVAAGIGYSLKKRHQAKAK